MLFYVFNFIFQLSETLLPGSTRALRALPPHHLDPTEKLCVLIFWAQGCQIWLLCGQDILLEVHPLKFFKLQLRTD